MCQGLSAALSRLRAWRLQMMTVFLAVSKYVLLMIFIMRRIGAPETVASNEMLPTSLASIYRKSWRTKTNNKGGPAAPRHSGYSLTWFVSVTAHNSIERR